MTNIPGNSFGNRNITRAVRKVKAEPTSSPIHHAPTHAGSVGFKPLQTTASNIHVHLES